MTTMTATRTRVSLELGCSDECDEFAGPLLLQMGSGRYNECAVLPLPATLEEWRGEHRTARKRADRATRKGYRFLGVQRHLRAAELHQINTSAPERQGRPMSLGYQQPPSETPLPVYPCPRHAVRTYGVETSDGQLVAYCWIYRAGDLALVSQILGHLDHLENEIMYLLAQGVIGAERDGHLVYNRYDSGGEGLRFFKDRCGFEPTEVDWQP